MPQSPATIETLQTQLQRLYQALAQTADAMLRAKDEAGLLHQVCTELVTNTPFHAAWIRRPEKDGRIQVLAAAGGSSPLLPQSGNAPPAVRAWMQQQLVYNNDLLADPQLAPWMEFLQRNAWHAALAVPIVRSGAPWAVLAVASPQKGVFDEQTVALFRRIGDLLGQGLTALDTQR